MGAPQRTVVEEVSLPWTALKVVKKYFWLVPWLAIWTAMRIRVVKSPEREWPSLHELCPGSGSGHVG